MTSTASTENTGSPGSSEPGQPGRSGRLTRVWEAVGRLGTGLVVGTFLLAFVVLRSLATGDPGGPVPAPGIWRVPLLLALIVTLTVFIRDRREPNPDPSGSVTSAFFVLLGSCLVVLLITMPAFLPSGSFVFTAVLFDEPYQLNPTAVALWAVPVTLLVGLVLLLVSHRWPRTRPWKRSAAPFAVGLVLALLAAPGMRALSEHLPAEHTHLAQAPDGAAPYPDSVSRLGWEWQPPEGATVVDIERGPLGPVVTLTDGLVGLDGGTGEELWSYRHPLRDVTTAVQAGADRAHMLLPAEDVQELGGRLVRNLGEHWVHDLLRGGRVTVLDTSTGEVVEEVERASVYFRTDVVVPGPGLTVHGSFGQDFGVRAFEAGATEPLWDFHMETDEDGLDDEGLFCWSHENRTLNAEQRRQDLLVQGDQVLVGYGCVDPADFEDFEEMRVSVLWSDERSTSHLVALDLFTGEENWSRVWEGPLDSPTLNDGGPVLNPGAAPAVVTEGFGPEGVRVLDAADGSEVLTADQGTVRWTDFRRADTGGAVAHRREEMYPDSSVNGESEVFERVDASGEVTGVVRLRGVVGVDEHVAVAQIGTVPLTGGVALPFVVSEEPGADDVPTLMDAPFQSADPGPKEATEGAGVLTDAAKAWDEDGSPNHDAVHRSVLVPGAVVSFVADEGERVHGWQP